MAIAGNLWVIGCMGVLSPAGQELREVGDGLGCCLLGVHTRESDECLRLRGSGRHRGILSQQPASSGSCPRCHRALQGKRPRSLNTGREETLALAGRASVKPAHGKDHGHLRLVY